MKNSTKQTEADSSATQFYIDRLERDLVNQTILIEHLLTSRVFSYEDMYHLYDEEEEENVEVFQWLHYSDDSSRVLSKLDDAKIPYLHNEYGLWIGRTSLGQAWRVDIIPAIS